MEVMMPKPPLADDVDGSEPDKVGKVEQGMCHVHNLETWTREQ